jgi:MoaA/NifB/PqqE/SkfB family radical SAM enzyme
MGFIWNYVRNVGALARGRQPVRPLIFSYYVTHRCGLDCRYCCDGDGKRFKEDPIPELTTAEARRLISILARSGDTLDVTGGEPMVRDDLEEILAQAQAAGMRTVLNTKGLGLSDRRDILRYTDVLVLSLDSLRPEALAPVLGRSREVAERVLDGFRFALEARRSGATSARLVLSVVATPENLDEVRAVMDVALSEGMGFHISPEIVGTTVHPALPGNAAYRALIDDVLRAKRARRGVLGVPRYFEVIRDLSDFHCHPLVMPTIRPDGRLYYPCLEAKHAEVSILEIGDYPRALAQARERFGEVPACRGCCHVFCHLGLSLYQRRPLAALAEWRHWAAVAPRARVDARRATGIREAEPRPPEERGRQ